MKRQIVNILFNTDLGIISPENRLPGGTTFNSSAAVSSIFTTTATTTTTTPV
ncbi:MAG: hypothetical protein ACQER7_10990 [Bacteroidota bacterium]